MFRKLIGFETKLQTRQIGFWIAFLAMFVISLLLFTLDGFTVSVETGERVKANGSITLALQTASFSLLSIFFGAVFVVNGVMRDETTRMLEIIHATPISTRTLTSSRIFGAFLATYLCIFAVSLGLFAGQFAPWLDKETIGPINLVNFLYPALILSFVNALFVTAFFTLIAGFTRNQTAVYVSAIGLLMLYSIAGIASSTNTPDWVGVITDPFGIIALSTETKFWSTDERNYRALPLWGWIGLNRLLWTGIAFVMLLSVFAKFKRGLVSRKLKPSKVQIVFETAPIPLASVTPRLGLKANLVTFMTRLKYEYFTTVKSIAFIILVCISVALFAIVLFSTLYMSPGKVWPTSVSMIEMTLWSLAPPLTIMVIFFAGETIWRDRLASFHEILDSTPARNWPFMAAKWLSLILMVLTVLTIGMVFTMIVQFFVSDISVNVGTYLKITYLSVTPFALSYAILALFIQNFLPNRVLGMLVAGGVWGFVLFFLSDIPFYHPLMNFGLIGPGDYSEMAGFSGWIRFRWYNLYWGSFCGLMALFTLWVWRRGLQTNLISRLKSIPTQISPRTQILASLLLVAFIGSGGYIFKTLNIDSTYYTDKAAEERSVAREKLFATEMKLNVPKIQSVDVEIDFKPSKGTATVKGGFILKNTQSEPIVELYIDPPSTHSEEVLVLEIDGAERVRSGINSEGDKVEDIEDYNYILYRFDPPLVPGAESRMRFEVFWHAPRLNDGSPVKRNGTFVRNSSFLPSMGIADLRLGSPDKRRKYGLEALEGKGEREDIKARMNNLLSDDGDYVDFKSKMCTDLGQYAISPGKLLREYTENGRFCRDYEAINPILNFFSFVSADYAVKKDIWENPNGRDVEILIYYYEGHHYNIDLMIKATQHAFDTYTKFYGPYPYHQMRILEIPYINFAQAFAGTVPFTENGFLSNPGVALDMETIDYASAVTMHEVGHQWFGHQIVPADVKGASILTEGLTENATRTAYESLYGWQKTRFMIEKDSMEDYLSRRAYSLKDEPPLALTDGQSYLSYAKSDWVFWGLKHYLGEDALQGAIKKFVTEQGSKGPPYATTLQLVAYLREAAGPDYQGLITDYFDRITFWKLSFGKIETTVKENENGGFSIRLPVIIDKVFADEKTGKDKSVSKIDGESLDEWVEIGFYSQDPKETLGDDWILLKRVRLTQDRTVLTFDMDEEPSYVLLDPRRLLIERDVKDNVKKLK